MESRTWIGREDVERRRLDALADRPVDRPLEYGGVSKPTKRLRSPASTAFSSRPGSRIAFTVPAACHSRPMPRIPSNKPFAN